MMAAATALLRRARMGLLLAAAGIGRDRFEFWQGYAKGVKDMAGSTGQRLADKDAASAYVPLGGFEAAAEHLHHDIEVLTRVEVANLLAKAGVEIAAQPLPDLDVVAAHQLQDGELPTGHAHSEHAAARVVKGDRSDHGCAPAGPGSMTHHAGYVTIDTICATLFGTCLTAAVLCWLGPIVLDGGPTYESYGYREEVVERAVAVSVAADVAWCQHLHGENATAVQLPDGESRCADKHGRRLPSSVVTIAHEVRK